MTKMVVSAAGLMLLLPAASAYAVDVQGWLSTEGSLFTEAPAYGEQHRNNGSLAMDMKGYHAFATGSSITVEPFYRLDSSDPNRTHGDLRIGNFLYVADQWQVVAGVDKVFWGVTEFVHLVDIINQTDTLESIDGEEKLGQPMIRLTAWRDWGTLDAFLLPYFRERPFPGKKGRLRGPLCIDDTKAAFESSAGKHHLDLALRYSHTLGNWDLGLYQFYGTSRDPLFRENESEDHTLIPYYQQISQTGTDLQYLHDQWLWKFEGLYQTGKKKESGALVFGFEYTLVGIGDSKVDLGMIGEYVFDERAIAANSLYNNDMMLGLRINLNNPASTEFLFGLIQDMRRDSTAFLLECSHRLNNSFKLELSGVIFCQIDPTDPASVYRDDSFLKAVVMYYF